MTTFENFINFLTEGFIFIFRKRSGGIHCLIMCRNIGIQRLLFGYAKGVFRFLGNWISIRGRAWFIGGYRGFLSVFAAAFGGVVDGVGC